MLAYFGTPTKFHENQNQEKKRVLNPVLILDSRIYNLMQLAIIIIILTIIYNQIGCVFGRTFYWNF